MMQRLTGRLKNLSQYFSELRPPLSVGTLYPVANGLGRAIVGETVSNGRGWVVRPAHEKRSLIVLM